MLEQSSSSHHHIFKTNDVYKKFNKAYKLFLKDLMVNFPQIKELGLVYTIYKVVKTFGKKLVQRYFNESLGQPFGNHILNRDEEFFMSPAFQLPPNYKFYNSYIPPFQRLWKTMDAQNKDAIWRHMQFLLQLSNECIAYKKDKKHTKYPISQYDGEDSEKEHEECCKQIVKKIAAT